MYFSWLYDSADLPFRLFFLLNLYTSDHLSFLCSGLGAGISTNSLQRHNISVDIVELDPAVYDLARDFFNIKPVDPLGATHRAFFQDGRQFLKSAAEKVKQIEVDAVGGTDGGGEEAKELKKRIAAATAPLLYDYVLHDVFTGGSLPVQLFTVEALMDIKTVLKKDGILALACISGFQL